MLDRLSLSRPMCANFKYLDALPLHPKCKIYFLTQTCRWSTPLNEVGDQFLASFDFKFGERHSISAALPWCGNGAVCRTFTPSTIRMSGWSTSCHWFGTMS